MCLLLLSYSLYWLTFDIELDGISHILFLAFPPISLIWIVRKYNSIFIQQIKYSRLSKVSECLSEYLDNFEINYINIIRFLFGFSLLILFLIYILLIYTRLNIVSSIKYIKNITESFSYSRLLKKIFISIVSMIIFMIYYIYNILSNTSIIAYADPKRAATTRDILFQVKAIPFYPNKNLLIPKPNLPPHATYFDLPYSVTKTLSNKRFDIHKSELADISYIWGHLTTKRQYQNPDCYRTGVPFNQFLSSGRPQFTKTFGNSVYKKQFYDFWNYRNIHNNLSTYELLNLEKPQKILEKLSLTKNDFSEFPRLNSDLMLWAQTQRLIATLKYFYKHRLDQYPKLRVLDSPNKWEIESRSAYYLHKEFYENCAGDYWTLHTIIYDTMIDVVRNYAGFKESFPKADSIECARGLKEITKNCCEERSPQLEKFNPDYFITDPKKGLALLKPLNSSRRGSADSISDSLNSYTFDAYGELLSINKSFSSYLYMVDHMSIVFSLVVIIVRFITILIDSDSEKRHTSFFL